MTCSVQGFGFSGWLDRRTWTNSILKLANVGWCDAQTVSLELKALLFCGRRVLDKEHVAFGRRLLTYHATVSDATVDAHDEEDDDQFHASTRKHPECRSQPPNPLLRNALSNVSHALTLKMMATITEKDRRAAGADVCAFDDEATAATDMVALHKIPRNQCLTSACKGYSSSTSPLPPSS